VKKSESVFCRKGKIMKRIFVAMFLVLCFFTVIAEEITYQQLLEQNPEYVKVQNELKELEKQQEDLKKSILPEVDKEALKKDPALRKKREKMENAFYRMSEYQRLYLEHDIKDFERKILESQFCLTAEDPNILTLIKEQYIEEQKDFKPKKDISELPKKNIPGSPEFQYAMYVLDELKGKKGLKKEDIWDATRHAFNRLEYKLRKAFFDEPKWRKFYYEDKYATSKYYKRYQELRLENIDLRIQQFTTEKIKKEYFEMEEEYRRIYNELEEKEKADPIYQELKNKMEEKEKAELIYQELKNELKKKIEEDPVLQKLEEEKSRVDRKWPTWDSLVERSQLPAAVEYRQFRDAQERIIYADKFAYEAYLEQDPEYAKIKNEMDELEAKRNEVYKSFISEFDEDAFEELPTSSEEYQKIRTLLDKSPEYQGLLLEYWIKETEQKMLEVQLCAAVEDPDIFEFIKKRHSQMSFETGINSSIPMWYRKNSPQQKDIPGSREFRYAMYRLDEIKEEKANLSDELKERNPDYYENYIPVRIAYLRKILLHNVRTVSYDDPACREAYYAKKYARLTLCKYSYELELANMDLWINVIPQGKVSRQSTEEMVAKEKADPLYQKLLEEKNQAELNEQQVLENFARYSDLPKTKEYREFEAAAEAVLRAQ